MKEVYSCLSRDGMGETVMNYGNVKLAKKMYNVADSLLKISFDKDVKFAQLFFLYHYKMRMLFEKRNKLAGLLYLKKITKKEKSNLGLIEENIAKTRKRIVKELKNLIKDYPNPAAVLFYHYNTFSPWKEKIVEYDDLYNRYKKLNLDSTNKIFPFLENLIGDESLGHSKDSLSFSWLIRLSKKNNKINYINNKRDFLLDSTIVEKVIKTFASNKELHLSPRYKLYLEKRLKFFKN